jgi:hypothetical protein
MMNPSYPVQAELEAPLEVANWRPLVHWLLDIPHQIIAGLLIFLFEILSVISWFAILFTGNIPEGIFNLMAMCLRYYYRNATFQYFMRESYPPFDFTTASTDPGGDPASVSIERPDHLSRGLIFIKWLLVIPHFIALFVLGIGAAVSMIIGFFAVLFTGRWPRGLRDYMLGVLRWGLRVIAYAGLMTDVYPPFALS